MTIKKINGSTLSVGGVNFSLKDGLLKIGKNKAMPVEQAFAAVSKGTARKVRKALHQMGHYKLASAKRAA